MLKCQHEVVLLFYNLKISLLFVPECYNIIHDIRIVHKVAGPAGGFIGDGILKYYISLTLRKA